MPKPGILPVDDEPTLLKRHPKGFILTGPDLLEDGKPSRDWPLRRAPYWLEASVPGIFVARGRAFPFRKARGHRSGRRFDGGAICTSVSIRDGDRGYLLQS